MKNPVLVYVHNQKQKEDKAMAKGIVIVLIVAVVIIAGVVIAKKRR